MPRPSMKTKKTTTKSIAAKEEVIKPMMSKPAVSKPAPKKDPVLHKFELYQGGAKIDLEISPAKARTLIKCIIKRNLREFPLTVIDVNGVAHTLRGLDRASYPSGLLENYGKAVVI